MNYTSFFSEQSKASFQNEPPGEWMPNIPNDCIRLSSGYPDPQLVPVQEIDQAVHDLLTKEQDLPLHYLGTPKMDQLKSQITKHLNKRHISLQESELLVTAGACQAIDLISRVFMDRDTVVAIEKPTYMEALEIFKNYTSHFVEIPIDDQGMDTEQFEKMLMERKKNAQPLPKMVYTIPTFHNPTGTTMPVERRHQLMQLASEYDFLIIEDHAYGDLYFDELPPPLKSLDKEGRVLHVGSLSKIVAPGLRIGWIATTETLIQKLYWFKKDLDHPFLQAVMSTYLESYSIAEQSESLRLVYKEKAETMTRALELYMPEEVTWFYPDGGYFVWIQIDGVDTTKLLTTATENGVSYIPGEFFFLNREEGKSYLRLSYSYESKEQIEKGIKLLADVIKNNNKA
ncbi:2-aminoadipate transaminase [Gracilibacillus halotolerans]|uniref:2-aminoadipate transaminase n=1 Tax=Gracilibacillus halotolerans TaxID=74386 RepID=A0A841RLF3_9BACI|nr:PLP-dependent aminotransferase family protein [Gracilibacillus halotolerans]MBB6512453.1 2-aminoadipate transaminase [Gracilibacillus halotolerans]